MGWVRANILYDKGPMPKLNSYQEVVHVLVFEATDPVREFTGRGADGATVVVHCMHLLK